MAEAEFYDDKHDQVVYKKCLPLLRVNHVAQSVQGNWNSGEGAAVEKKANSLNKGKRKWACTPAKLYNKPLLLPTITITTSLACKLLRSIPAVRQFTV